MGKIWLTSDTHFCHNKDFIFNPRGFNDVDTMNTFIKMQWNYLINPEDDIYLLGDVFLIDDNTGLEFLKSLKGKIHIILGNHDSEDRIKLFKTCENVVEITYATKIKSNGFTFILSHYPMLIHNFKDDKPLWNLHGHTHSPDKFSEFYHCYNVALDAHNNRPVELDEIINDIKGVYNENPNLNN